jgi:hypothetical protein
MGPLCSKDDIPEVKVMSARASFESLFILGHSTTSLPKIALFFLVAYKANWARRATPTNNGALLAFPNTEMLHFNPELNIYAKTYFIYCS